MEKDSGMTPRALQDRPAMRPDVGGYLAAFQVLSASRLCIQGTYQPIQIGEIDTYLTRFLGVRDAEEREKVLYLIQEMDTVYLTKKAKEQEQ